MGRGNRWGFYATGQPGWARGWDYNVPPYYGRFPEATEQDEIEYLKSQAKSLTKALEEINLRIDELSKTKEKSE
jgi:hypothetical protein